MGKGIVPNSIKEYHFWVRNYENPVSEEKLIKVNCRKTFVNIL